MTILVDMDDTIEQLLPAWIQGLNEKFDRHVACEDVLSWDVDDAYPDLTHEQILSVPMEPGFWSTVEPVPGAVEALQRLMDAGHEVYIVTATLLENIPEKMNDLLFRYFPFLSWNQVIITHDKQMIRGDVLIDDAVHNLEGGDYAKLLMTAPHNKNYDAEANGMIRVNNWAEIEAVIAALEEKQFLDVAQRILEQHKTAFDHLAMGIE